MRFFIRLFLLFLILPALHGCSKKSESAPSHKTSQDGEWHSTPYTNPDAVCAGAETEGTAPWTYRFVRNGCDTGTHRSVGLTEHCTALQTQDLNHYCSVVERYYCFLETCPGMEWHLITGQERD